MKRYVLALLAALCATGTAFVGGVAGAQQGASIKITEPAAGATVASPVTLAVDIQGVPVKAAAEGDPNAFHYHALVDVDPSTVLVPGQPIPTGQSNIIHTADPNLTLPDLAPGQHTVVAVLTRTDHVPLSPTVQDRITFTVGTPGTGGPGTGGPGAAASGQTPVAAPRVGTGGLLAADTEPSLPLMLTVALVMALGGGGLALRMRGR
ncbi:MAG: DUF4399 domain-containing protein [Dehalococcoidia bacterium]